MNNPPILIIAYNRPHLLKKLISKLPKSSSIRIYIAIDGPKNEYDKLLVSETKKIALRALPHAKKKYSQKNLGCKVAVSSAIDWFFTHESSGIILEDDCIPNPTFFSFCSSILKKYAKNNRIMHVSGNNFQGGIKRGMESYYFSRIPHIWGWATWKRAWEKYDVSISSWPHLKKNKLLHQLSLNHLERKYWTDIFDRVYQNTIDTWDYQWTFALWKNNGIAVTPNFNLVTNLGFGLSATHTQEVDRFANQPTQSIYQIKHPSKINIHFEADKFTLKHNFNIGLKLYITKIATRPIRRMIYRSLQLKHSLTHPTQLRPAISFIMPAYNAENTIRQSVESIILGNFKESDELIIVEDGSTDGTLDAISSFTTNPQIQIVKNNKNKGCPQSRNIGIRLARNSYIFNLDADDVLAKKSVDKLMLALLKNNADVVAFSESRFFTKTTKDVTHRWLYPVGWYNLQDFFTGNKPPGGNFLYTKSIWEKAGGYTELSLGLHEFWGFTLKLLLSNAKYIVVKNSHYYHRYKHSSIFSRLYSSKSYYKNSNAVATQLIKPAINLLSDESARQIKSNPRWFDDLDKFPFIMRNHSIGRRITIKYSPKMSLERFVYKFRKKYIL